MGDREVVTRSNQACPTRVLLLDPRLLDLVERSEEADWSTAVPEDATRGRVPTHPLRCAPTVSMMSINDAHNLILDSFPAISIIDLHVPVLVNLLSSA